MERHKCEKLQRPCRPTAPLKPAQATVRRGSVVLLAKGNRKENLCRRCSTNKGAQATHKGIPEPTEQGLVLDLLGENVGNVVDPGDVLDVEKTILDPLPDRVFPHLHVIRGFGSHVVTPLHTGLVVVVDRRRSVSVR